MDINKHLIKRELLFELARREFFFYCYLKAPDFYKKDRKYLVELCSALQSFLTSKNEDVLVINAPP